MATQPHDRRKFKAEMKQPAPPRAFVKRNEPHGPNRYADGWDGGGYFGWFPGWPRWPVSK